MTYIFNRATNFFYPNLKHVEKHLIITTITYEFLSHCKVIPSAHRSNNMIHTATLNIIYNDFLHLR